MKAVATYGMSPDVGLTTWAPRTQGRKFMERTFEVNVDQNLEEELFGRGRGHEVDFLSPSDATMEKIRVEAIKMLREAEQDCREILIIYRSALITLTDVLLDKDEVHGEEIEAEVGRVKRGDQQQGTGSSYHVANLL